MCSCPDEDDMGWPLISSQSGNFVWNAFLSWHTIQKFIFAVKCCPNYLVVKKEFEFLLQCYFFPFCFDFYSLTSDCVMITVTFVRLIKASSCLNLITTRFPAAGCTHAAVGWAGEKPTLRDLGIAAGALWSIPAFSSPMGGLMFANPLRCKLWAVRASPAPCFCTWTMGGVQGKPVSEK